MDRKHFLQNQASGISVCGMIDKQMYSSFFFFFFRLACLKEREKGRDWIGSMKFEKHSTSSQLQLTNILPHRCVNLC